MSQYPPPPDEGGLSGEPQVPPPDVPYGQQPPPGYPQTYPQQGYEQPYQYPLGFQPLQPPVHKPRQHWKWIVPVCVVAALAIGGLVWVFVRDPHPEDAKTSGRHLSLPASVSGYQLLRDYDTGQIKDRMVPLASNLGSSGEKLVDTAVVGAYAHSTSSKTPQLLFIAFPLKSVPALADEVRTEGADYAVHKVMDGAGQTSAHAVDSGSLGGAMSCGVQDGGAAVIGLCSWVDRSYVAMMILSSPDPADRTGTQLDTTFQQLRRAAEHS